ncbi:MAG TPA: MMPL family transporter [Gemmatimonadaceae bacterium]|nr:MMPL family transporter [Gemmatimonadaceae bacterium]
MTLDERDGRGTRLAHFVVHRRRWLWATWVVVAALLLPHARHAASRFEVAARVRGSESDVVSRLLAERFESPFARSAVMVVTGVPSPDTPAGRAALAALVDATGKMRGVTRTLSYLDVRDSAFIGRKAGTFVVVGLDPRRGSSDALVERLRAGTAAPASGVRAIHPGAEVTWTGEDALNHDLRLASARDVSSAERRALPLTLALLLLAFGAVVAATIPLGVGGLAIGLALGAAALVARVWPLSIALQNVVSMLGLGLGVDYTLLLVSRFREARAAGRDAEPAAIEAATHAGHSVLVSALAVAVGFAALLAVPLGDLRAIAAGGLLVVASSALLAVTLVPGLLAALGKRIEIGRVLPRARQRNASVFWRRFAARVARHPGRTLIIAGSPLIVLAMQARRLEPRLPRGDWLPRTAEAARGARALHAMGSGGVVQTLRVVVALPSGVRALDAVGYVATARIAAVLVRDPRVRRVRSLPGIANGVAPTSPLFAAVPEVAVRSLVSRDESLALLEVVPADTIDGSELPTLARELRALDAGAASGLPGTQLLVGGLPALNADYADAIARRTPLVVILVVGGTLLALAIGFRSVLVPLKAVALNLLTVGAALGIVVLVFQDGHGARLLGLAGPLEGTFSAVPLLVFCIVFGLSMDYEVFLLSRVAEARRRGASEGAALVAGVGRSGRVITSAASIMVVVFGAFALGDFVLVKILGVALAAAVVLDATLVRLAVGPALLALAGRWNWWPGSLVPHRAAPRASGRRVRAVHSARQSH